MSRDPTRSRSRVVLVGTPIGNLDDVSPRAQATLADADVVAAEDTRHTGRLLAHLGIDAAQVSYHDHNEPGRAAELVARAAAGETVAVVSDAGTPSVADPGLALVRAAVDAGVPVEAVPGPAAFLLALFDLFTGNVQIGIGPVAIQSPVLFNTPGAMILPFSSLFMPLAIFILTTFYAQIPDGLEDAARIEGTTRLGALFRVIMPLSAPGVATAGILTFIAVYNEFFFSFLMNDGQAQNWAPIVWGILGYQGQYTQFYNLMAAASIVGVLPVVILVVVAQEKIVSGLTAGALKE